MVMETDNRTAREREAMARAPRQHLEASEGIDAAAMGAEEAAYTPPLLDPQWMIAYKLFVDADGEYGVPYPVPVGQFHNGANALVHMRRVDGGYAWTSVPPERMAPKGDIECISDRCGDAHLGGRRKMLPHLRALIEHVEAFHPEDARAYRKYLDQIADQLAVNNPRLQKLMDSVGAAAAVGAGGPEAFYCDDDECTRFFDTAQGKAIHMSKEHKEAASV